MKSNEPNRNIPLQIQREVRQRCGFGCVLCGLPIYDYEHMKEWSKVKEHVAADITLLCPQHHREVTAGRLPRKIIEEANNSPFNLKQGRTSSMQLYFQGDTCEFLIGGNSFNMESHVYPTQLIPLMIDGMPLLSFTLDNNHLLLNANIFDETNNLVLVIEDNQLIHSIDPWDIQFVGKTLTIREKKRKILISITFETPNQVIIDRARLLFNGVEVLIKDNYLLTGNNNSLFMGNRFYNIQGGIVIGSEPSPPIGAGVRITDVNRYYAKSKEAKQITEEILNESNFGVLKE